MPLLLAGIDEAGYGPTLGPLCVACAMFRLDAPVDHTPNLWKLLDSAVAREPGRAGAADARGRVAIADSKKLKLSNAVKTTHPLIHLERGVLSFLRAVADSTDPVIPATDSALFEALGVAPPWHTCYVGEEARLPVSMTPGELSISAAQVEAALGRAGLALLSLRCDVTPERDFNQVILETGSKGDTTLAAVGRHLRRLWDSLEALSSDTSLAIACDRLGGRIEYAAHLEALLPGVRAEISHESPARSAYTLHGRSGRRAGIVFLTEGEDAHLPVALASMTAKYVRELLMYRFNDHWGRRFRDLRGVELKPTAGYAQDARRWLDQIGDVFPAADRASLVRIA